MINGFDRENRRSDWVCNPCGVPYLTEAQLKEDRIHTAHLGECCICGRDASVMHIRNYNYLRKPKG